MKNARAMTEQEVRQYRDDVMRKVRLIFPESEFAVEFDWAENGILNICVEDISFYEGVGK